MDSSNFSKLLHSLRSLKVKFINLSGGGEPTLHPSFSEFVEMCIGEEFKLSLLTNAVWLENMVVELLVDGLSFLTANLDASNDEVYNRIHNPPHRDEFQKVLAGLERIVSERQRRKSDLIVGAEVRLCGANLNFVEEITRLAADLGLNYVEFRVWQTASDPLHPDQTESVQKLIEELKASFSPFPLHAEIRSRRPSHECWLAPVLLAVGPSGDVYPCPHFASRPGISAFGNIFALPAHALWFGPEHRGAVEQLKGSKCHIQDCRWHFSSELAGLPHR